MWIPYVVDGTELKRRSHAGASLFRFSFGAYGYEVTGLKTHRGPKRKDSLL
jgi:hypothetical protein